MILLFGAEFTQTWAVRKGSGIEPKKGARRMIDETGEADRPQPSQRGKGGGKRSHSSDTQPSSAAPAANAGRGHRKRKTPLLDARRREIAEEEARKKEQ
jgi:hypothetical protein